MTMAKKYIIGILAFLSFSCSGFLEEYSQDQAYVRSYTDLDELLIGSGYPKSDFNDLSFDGYCPYIHLMADEIQENAIDDAGFGPDFTTPRDRYFGYYTWQQRVDLGYDKTVQGEENADWNLIYEHINVVNMIISEISGWSGQNDTEQADIDRVRGEAYFLRGMYYFWLVNLYGQPYTAATAATDPGVPLKTSEYIEDKKFTRSSVQEVYEQVLADLSEAEKNLENAPVKSVYRTNITATYLLQSRVYLYMRNWEKAREYAQKVLDKNGRLIDLNAFSSGSAFLTSGSVETIFSTGNNWVQQNAASFNMKGMSTSQDLLDAYTSGDLRAEVFFNQENNDYTSYRPCNKYGAFGNISVSDNHLFRTAEAYLNLAEACAYLNDETAARQALNTLRKNRFALGSNNQEITSSGKELVEEIRNERYRELCFEGHRWYDLRRYSVCDRYPLTKILRNTYTLYVEEDGDELPAQTFVYELKPGDAAYILPIPKEVVQFDQLPDNPRPVRPVAETINYN